uniref:Uncharacterized protein n=1 Tax=Meloidogyne incognita TaxID=6306 RepID=A0A914MFN4_MELIC
MCGWEMELNHHGMSPDRSTTDCATIQPNAGLFIFIYILSASADTTLLPPCEIKRPRLLLVFNNYHLFRFLESTHRNPFLWHMLRFMRLTHFYLYISLHTTG